MSVPESIKLDHVFRTQCEKYRYEIHWTSFGLENGTPLVFVHGTPWSSNVWAPYAKALSARFKVYLFDNPGFGQSPGRELIERSQDGGDDLDASLSGQSLAFAKIYHECWKLDGQQVHVIAHDNGGLVTLRAHLLHSCKYASLCLVDVVAIRPFGSPFFRLVAANRSVFESIPGGIFEGTIRAYINGARHKELPPGIEDMLAAPWLEGGSQGQRAFIRQMVQADQRHAEEVESRYGEVAIPVKVIWGKEDHWIPADRAERLGKMINAKEVVIMDEAGHLIMYDQPERLGIELALWLASVHEFRS